MRHALEALESRFLLSSGGVNASGLVSSLIADPSAHNFPILLHQEQEPNDSLDQANAIELRPAFNCSRLCPLDANHAGPAGVGSAGPGLRTLTSDLFPLPWWFDHRLEAFVAGDLSDTPGDKDTDDFSFSADARSKIHVAFFGAALADGVLPQLLDANGNVIATAEPDQKDHTGAVTSATIEYFTSRGGKFFIQVGPGSDSNGDGSSAYDMHVVVSTNTHVEHEPNDTLATANAIDLEPGFTCWEVCVAGPSATGSSSGSDSATATGTSLRPIWFPGPGLDGGVHGFIEGSLDNRVNPAMDCPVVGCNVVRDLDFFSFSADAERLITLRFEGDAAHPSVLPQLLDSNGNVLVTAEAHDHDGDGVPDSVTLEYFTQAGADFFVKVGPNSNEHVLLSEHYSLTVTVAADPHHEHEPNNDFTTANTIVLEGSPWWHCDILCPLDASGNHSASTGSAQPDQAGLNFPLPIRLDQTLHGFVDGELSITLNLDAPPPPLDVDFFSIKVPADRLIHVNLTGELVGAGGQATLFDHEMNELVSTQASTIGAGLEWTATEGGSFFVRVNISGNDVRALLRVPIDCPLSESAHCGLPNGYRLDVSIAPSVNPTQGPDETEPNDTLEQANILELDELPIGACCIDLRGGDAHGIAGGPTNDQDAWKFDIHADEHVTVAAAGLVTAAGGGIFQSIDDWITAGHLNQFGDPAGTVYAGGNPLFHEVTGKLIGRVTYILRNHPGLSLAPMQTIVYDADGNEIGRAIDDSTAPHAVEFDAATDATYYAVVSVAPNSTNTDPVDPVHYRLGVLARGSFVHPQPDPIGHEPPHVIMLNSGATFDYTDSSGDKVHILYRGAGGHATITFTDSAADGSDIASVVIDGVRRGGNLSIQTAGTAEVGSVEVHGVRRGRRMLGGFGNVQIDGNVGSLSSDVNLRAVAVDGLLGQIEAHSRQIASVSAGVFDSAMANVGSIRSLHVDEDFAAALFHRFLPWEQQP